MYGRENRFIDGTELILDFSEITETSCNGYWDAWTLQRFLILKPGGFYTSGAFRMAMMRLYLARKGCCRQIL